MTTKIDKIVLKIGKNVVELSPDEAKELKDMLNELYGGEQVKYIPSPYTIYPRWIYSDPWEYTRWTPPIITWGNTDGASTGGTIVTYSASNITG